MVGTTLQWVATDHLLLLSCSQFGFTAVLCAAADGHLDLLRKLVEHHGADLYHKTKASDYSDYDSLLSGLLPGLH